MENMGTICAIRVCKMRITCNARHKHTPAPHIILCCFFVVSFDLIVDNRSKQEYEGEERPKRCDDFVCVVKRIITGLQAKHHQIEQKNFQVLFIVFVCSLLTIFLLFERIEKKLLTSVGYYQRRQYYGQCAMHVFLLFSFFLFC